MNGAVVGQIKVVDFSPAPTFRVPAYAPLRSSATKAEIREGMLESSNVNPIASAVDLITTQRYSDLMQRALSLFDAQFNRIATEDLPRIS